MALDSVGLANSILNHIAALSEEDKASRSPALSAWADGINSYIKENMEINGVYAGVLAGTPPLPDPLSGSHVWKVSAYVLTGAMIEAACNGLAVPSAAFAALKLTIGAATKAITSVGSSDPVAVSVSTGLVLAPFVFDLSQSDLVGSGSYTDVIVTFADKLVTSLKQTAISGIATPAVSTGGGTGTVTYSNIM